MIPVIVISLTASVERRAAISSRLASLNIPFRFLDAVDGRTLAPERVKAITPERYYGQYGRILTPSEVGCALSHIEAARQVADGGHAYGCVLEDDGKFDQNILPFLEADLLRGLPAFDVLRLCNARLNTALCWYAAVRHGREIVAPFLPGYMAVGLIYSRAGAEKVVRHSLPLRGPIDNMIFRDGFVPGLKTLEARPALVTTAWSGSTVAKNFLQPTFYSSFRKKIFMLGRSIRTVRNFAGAWGPFSFFRLRTKSPFRKPSV